MFYFKTDKILDFERPTMWKDIEGGECFRCLNWYLGISLYHLARACHQKWFRTNLATFSHSASSGINLRNHLPATSCVKRFHQDLIVITMCVVLDLKTGQLACHIPLPDPMVQSLLHHMWLYSAPQTIRTTSLLRGGQVKGEAERVMCD